MPQGCTAVDTIGTINVNVGNLAPLYGNQSVAPDLAAAVDIAAGANPWTLGAATATIVTASNYTFTGIHLEQLSAEGTYQINLYYAGTLFCSAVFSRIEHAVIDSVYIPIRSAKITGAITAKLASAAGGSETAKIKLIYV